VEGHGLWVSFWGGPRAVGAVTHDLHRLVATPLKVDWRCWHGCVREGAYPDYFPPREGTEVFAQAMHQLAEAGMLTQLGFDGGRISPHSDAWRSEEAAASAIESGAADTPEPADGEIHPLVPMCFLTDYWREQVSEIAARTLALGAGGVYLEGVIGSARPACRRPEHGHEVGGREEWVRGCGPGSSISPRTAPPSAAWIWWT